MKGLLLKDAYMTVKLCKAFILMDIVFIAVSFWGDGNMFFIVYPCIISGMLPMTLISYDRQQRWDVYAGTLPYTRAQLVSAKYLIGLCGNVITLSLITVALALKMPAGRKFTEYAAVMITLLSMSLIAPALLFPPVFKFGVEKGRILYYIVIGVACGCSTALINMDISLVAKLNDFLVCIIFLTFAVLLYLVSWFLSIRFYGKREL